MRGIGVRKNISHWEMFLQSIRHLIIRSSDEIRALKMADAVGCSVDRMVENPHYPLGNVFTEHPTFDHPIIRRN